MTDSGFLQSAPAVKPVASSIAGGQTRAAGWTVRLFEWLAAHPRCTTVVTLIYLAYVILSHDLMQQPAYWAQGQLSHERWNHLVTCVAVPILAAFCVWLLAHIVRHPRWMLAGFYLLITVALMAAAFRSLLVMNIEIVHYPQYAILSALTLAICRSFTATMIWATLAALLDEGYQYFYLYASRGIHFDFNDVVLNGIGAGFGLVLVFCVAGPRSRSVFDSPIGFRLLQSKAVWLAAAALTMCTVLALTQRLRLLAPTDGSWAIVLRRGGPSSAFWTPTTWGKTYHEIQPLEWLAVAAALILLYGLLDRVRVRRDLDTP